MTETITVGTDTEQSPNTEKNSVGIVRLSQAPTTIPYNEIYNHWYESLEDAKFNVAAATPLLAYMMFRCRVSWTFDPAVPTAGAAVFNNENHLYINPAFWMHRLSNTQERAFVLLHEVLHIFQEHPGRQEENSYHHELWNIATDYVINLVASGAYLPLDSDGNPRSTKVEYNPKYTQYLSRPSFVLYQERFINMSADEVYFLLLEENDNDAEKACKAHGGGQRPGEDQSQSQGQGQGDGGGQEPGQGDGSQGQGQGGKGGKKRGPGAPKGQMPLDSVSDATPSEAHTHANRHASYAAVAQTSQGSNTMGDGEAWLRRYFEQLNEPRVDWRDQVDQVAKASTRERNTYSRLSRRSSIGGVKFPTKTGERVNIAWCVDTSGSMGQDDLSTAASELQGILNQFDSWNLYLITCDTRAYEVGRYSSEEQDDFSNVSLDWMGGGGTDMAPMIEYVQTQLMEDEDIEINACIVITDGYVPEERMNDAFAEIMQDVDCVTLVTEGGNAKLKLSNSKMVYMKDKG